MSVLENNSAGSMKDNAKVSIIVPIYNVERYLSRCLDSIIGQTHKNIEIILIDDGSPDNAGTICDEYAAKDNRIIVHHIPNGGVAKARQLGVESSTSEYIVFVDPDDCLPLNSIEVLYSNIDDDIDIVIGNNTIVINDQEYPVKPIVNNIADITKSLLTLEINPTPWGNIYRRNLFLSNSFPNFKRSQDWLMFIDISMRVRAVKVISHPVYKYYRSETSTSIRFTTTIEYMQDFTSYAMKVLKENNMLEKYKYEYHEFLLECLCRINGSKSLLNKNDAWVQMIINDSQNMILSQRGKRLLMSIKHPLYNKFSNVLRCIILSISRKISLRQV